MKTVYVLLDESDKFCAIATDLDGIFFQIWVQLLGLCADNVELSSKELGLDCYAVYAHSEEYSRIFKVMSYFI